jgi:hypothetical protein
MSFSIGRNLAPKGLIVLAITLGGRDPESYIWLAMAEIQPGHFIGAPNTNQFGRHGVKIVGLRRLAACRPVCR